MLSYQRTSIRYIPYFLSTTKQIKRHHAHTYMSMEPYPVIVRLSKDGLREMLLSDNKSNIAVVDVRDSDHVGGHIKGSIHRPSTSLKYEMPALVRELQIKEVVVFHCALSQQRGPYYALKYMQERKDMLGSGSIEPYNAAASKTKGTKNKSEEEAMITSEQMEEGTANTTANAAGNTEKGKQEEGKPKDQVIYVLTGGFQEWQEKYGEDKQLTENYDKKLWQTQWY